MNLRPALAFLLLAAPLHAFAPGELVRLSRSEDLMFQGKAFAAAPKEAEFTVLKHDAVRKLVFVEYYKDDGTLIAVTAPADAFERSPASAWTDLLKGAEAFRDLRAEDARRLLARAAQDEQQRALASAIAPRVNAAFLSRSAPALQAVRDMAAQLAGSGQLCLALALDEGVDRFSGAPPTTLDRADLAKRVAISNRAVGRARQAIAGHRLFAARKSIEEGLAAEPGRAELKAFDEKIARDIEEADGHHKNANSMRRFPPKGTIHALTAIEMGLKVCVDHPKLRALKGEMQSAFEERTSPPVTPAFLALAGSGASKEALTDGHKLYTTRCAECHDLELLDSRTVTAWRSIVGGMAGRAKITREQEGRIVEYIAVAQRTLDGKGD